MVTHGKNKTFRGKEKQPMFVLYSVKVLISL